jgi:hypothetical protein
MAGSLMAGDGVRPAEARPVPSVGVRRSRHGSGLLYPRRVAAAMISPGGVPPGCGKGFGTRWEYEYPRPVLLSV